MVGFLLKVVKSPFWKMSKWETPAHRRQHNLLVCLSGHFRVRESFLKHPINMFHLTLFLTNSLQINLFSISLNLIKALYLFYFLLSFWKRIFKIFLHVFWVSCIEDVVTENFNFYFRTWSGPSWSPAQSLSTVLLSIQSLMNEKPYFNEPGFEKVSYIYY